MAKDPALLTNATAPNADHPSGRASDASPPGTGNGTTVNLDLYGDWAELTYKLMRESGFNFNNLPDSTSNGFQLFDALSGVIRGSTGFDVIYKDSPISIDHRTICFGNDLFLILGSNPNTVGYIFSSDKGNTWSSSTLSANDQIQGSVFGNGQFVLVSNANGTAYTSSDGSIWTLRNTGVTTNENVIYSDSLGLYINVCKTNGGATHEQVVTSADGITWTQRTAASVAQWDQVIEGDGLVVASDQADSNKLMTSTDGITWTSRTLPSNIFNKKLAYGNNVYVCVGENIPGSNHIFTSNDGITWTANTSHFSGAGTLVKNVFFSGGQFHLFGTELISAVSTDVYSTSIDGINWFTRKEITPLPTGFAINGDGRMIVSRFGAGTAERILLGI